MEIIKNLKYVAMIVFVAITSLSFASCSDDDDKDGSSSEIVGHWVSADVSDEIAHIVFNSNGMGNEWVVYKGKESDDYPFTWKESGNKIKIKYTDGDSETFEYSISNNRLYLIYDDGETETFKRYSK